MSEIASVLFSQTGIINATTIQEFFCALILVEFIGILFDAFKVGK